MTLMLSSISIYNNRNNPVDQSSSSKNNNQAADKNQPDNRTSAQLQEVQALIKQDHTVRNHEQAHISAAAGIAVSPPHYSFTTGPDGKQYATGGEVSIDSSEVPNDPQATLRKAEIIRRAALAPASPSAEDYNVAAQATAMAAKAAIELLQQQTQEKGRNINLRA